MIRGELVNLRAVERGDAARLHAWLNEPEAMRGWGTSAAAVSLVEVGRRLEGWLAEEAALGRPTALAIETLEGEAIGLVVVAAPERPEARAAELSLLIGEPARWGMGLGTDALRTALEACFGGWHLDRVSVQSEAGNARAHRIYARCGFRLEGTLRRAAFLDGRAEDVLLFGLLAEEWAGDEGAEGAEGAERGAGEPVADSVSNLAKGGRAEVGQGGAPDRWPAMRDGDGGEISKTTGEGEAASATSSPSAESARRNGEGFMGAVRTLRRRPRLARRAASARPVSAPTAGEGGAGGGGAAVPGDGSVPPPHEGVTREQGGPFGVDSTGVGAGDDPREAFGILPAERAPALERGRPFGVVSAVEGAVHGRGGSLGVVPVDGGADRDRGGPFGVASAVGAASQDPEEPFDVLSADGAPTGETKARAAVHREGDWHRAVHVWIAGVDGAGEGFLLVQRRGLGKDTWPGRLDATVGGHLRAGEGVEEAPREIEEELGVSVPFGDLRRLGTRRAVSETEPGVRDREVQEVFLLRDDRPLTDYRPNAAELAALVRVPLAGLLAMLAGEAETVGGEAIDPDGAERRASVEADDFVPTLDRYVYRVAIVAAAALRGERHVAV